MPSCASVLGPTRCTADRATGRATGYAAFCAAVCATGCVGIDFNFASCFAASGDAVHVLQHVDDDQRHGIERKNVYAIAVRLDAFHGA